MPKNIHLICNAHIDPVWQWEWEEGAAAAISTFRVAADFCEEYDDFVFCHNEAILYRWVEEYEPPLFERIKTLVAAGKWHIMGGWYLQPDCNMPSGEGFVRNILAGREYFREKFGAAPTTAINFDPFGHTRGLVQILKKSGYDSYMFCRPDPSLLDLPSECFEWVGYDGSTVTAQRVFNGYNSGLGHAVDKIKGLIAQQASDKYATDVGLVLWGIGDHGGGPSRVDLDAIAAYIPQAETEGNHVFHSTTEAYFAERKAVGVTERVTRDLNPIFPGCYTSQIRVKQQYRKLEGELFAAERICAHAAAAGLINYPRSELKEALYDLLTVQFHDSLPGSSIQPVEEMALRMMGHGLEYISRVRARAFFALAAGQREAASDEIPILVYNPHPYPVEGDFECEFMLWDQNWNDEFSMPKVYRDGELVPSQTEKELGNLSLDWRKRVVFHAKLLPSAMSRFDCKVERIPRKPVPSMPMSTSHLVFDHAGTVIKINRLTGLVDRYSRAGYEYLAHGAFTLEVMADSPDPWEMRARGWQNRVGRFTLMSPEDGSAFSNVNPVIPSVRVVEDGAVRTVVEAVFGWERSAAVMRYIMSKLDGSLSISIRINWGEKSKLLKLAIPTKIASPRCVGQVAFGSDTLPCDGNENVAQRWLALDDGSNAVGLVNNGTYGNSAKDGVLYQTLLRSPGYTVHPIGDRELLPQDRFSPYMEQGERLYFFRFAAGKSEEVLRSLSRLADEVNEPPMLLSFFPRGGGKIPPVGPVITGSESVELPAFKAAEDGDGFIARLFNPLDTPQTVNFAFPPLGVSCALALSPFEIKTLRVTSAGIAACGLDEYQLV
jgi:Alpha-mannosidase